MRSIRENLNQIKVEPAGNATTQAKQMGLSYVGFGRYEDSKSQQVTHVVQNDKLIPFKRAVKTNTFKTNNTDDIGAYNQMMSPQTQQIHQYLTAHYTPDKYDDKELDAIYTYTNGAYVDINNRLSSLPAGIPSNKIEPNSIDDPLPDFVASLDSALKKSRLPADIMVYTNVGSSYSPDNLQQGSSFLFKGYRDTSIDLGNVVNNADKNSMGYSGRPQINILQITLKKNSKGLYAADYSVNAADTEFILPRSCKITIVSGPQKLVGSDAMSQNLNLEIMYYDCVVKT